MTGTCALRPTTPMCPSVLALAALATLTAAPPATAQAAQPIAVGARVRVTSSALGLDRREGKVAALRADTLVLAASEATGRVTDIPFSSIERLEAKHRRPRSVGAWRGIGMGLLGGFAAGFLGGLAFTNPTDSSKEFAGVIIGIYGAGVGIVVGAIVGAANPGTRWERVNLLGPTSRLTEPAQVRTVGVSIAF